MFEKFRLFKKKIALITDSKKKYTYENLLTEIDRLNQKIKKRSLILIICNNSVSSILSYIFAIIYNHVGIMVDSKTSNKSMLKIIKNFQPNYIFFSKKYPKGLNKSYKKILIFHGSYILKKKDDIKIELNKDLTILLSTSGSMGSSKFVKLSKMNLAQNTKSIIKYLKINNKDKSITSLPLNYSYMLSVINTHLTVGGTIAVTDLSILQKKFWVFFSKSKCTSFNGVPYNYEILSKIGFKNLINGSLKILTQAGGKLEKKINLKIIDFCRKNKLRFYAMYGQTEASPRISYLNPKYSKMKIGSIGKAIPGCKIFLEDESKNKINKPFIEGELICKGKNVFMGYSESYKDLYKESQTKDILRTGDLSYFDNENFYFLTSRKNRVVKIFGNRIDIEQLENLLNKQKFDVYCVELKNKIIILSEKFYEREKLIRYASNETNLNIIAFDYLEINKFPKTQNGKIDYSKLKKIANDRL